MFVVFESNAQNEKYELKLIQGIWENNIVFRVSICSMFYATRRHWPFLIVIHQRLGIFILMNV
jgi:hypothetical protein